MGITYLANARLPTEKAHGLQIVQNCEALGAAGAAVTLVVPRRWNRPELRGRDVWQHYGAARTFSLRRLPCVDLFPVGRWFEPVAARLQATSFALAAAAARSVRRAEVVYSRDLLPLAVVSLMLPRHRLVYEAHQTPESRIGNWLERVVVRRASLVVAVTDYLADRMRARGARTVIVARDGFQPDRFAGLPGRGDAQREAGIPESAFCVGYVGQLHTMGMSKGLDVVVEALSRLRDDRCHLCLVGGPASAVAALRARWIERGMAEERFHAFGDVPAARVPRLLAAFDVAVMLLPWTPHFAYCASPLKLFEYMAAGRTIVVSDLPATREIVDEGITAMVVRPDDPDELAAVIARLRDDPTLRARLGAAARRDAQRYTWPVRAQRILDALSR